MSPSDCEVYLSDGVFVCKINYSLVLRQGVTDTRLNTLKELHRELYQVYRQMQATDVASELKALARQCTEIEFKQQEAWGFPKSESQHNWYKVPKCTCPKLDNADYRGTPYRIYSDDCPIHQHIN